MARKMLSTDTVLRAVLSSDEGSMQGNYYGHDSDFSTDSSECVDATSENSSNYATPRASGDPTPHGSEVEACVGEGGVAGGVAACKVMNMGTILMLVIDIVLVKVIVIMAAMLLLEVTLLPTSRQREC